MTGLSLESGRTCSIESAAGSQGSGSSPRLSKMFDEPEIIAGKGWQSFGGEISRLEVCYSRLPQSFLAWAKIERRLNGGRDERS